MERHPKQLVCPQGHSFDIARSGYINLLQPQDRRSRNPGDTAAAVAARRRLHERGFTQPLLDKILELVSSLPRAQVLDAGCGEGFYLGNLVEQTGCEGYGTDISPHAIEAAARRYKNCQWTIANADRFVPYADHSFSLILSITGRMNPPEYFRVLKPGGHLLVALAAAGDLIELRGQGKDRCARTVETFAPQFELIKQTQATSQADLDAAAVEDVLLSIYRPLQANRPGARKVTLSLDLLLFQARARSIIGDH